MPVTRREFLSRAAVGVAALTALEPLAVEAAQGPAFPIIDTHQHLWDLKTIRLPWLKDPGAAKIATPHTMAVYLREAAGLGIVKTIYMEVDAAEEDERKEAAFVIATCKSGKTPMKKGVISGRPGTPGFIRYAKQYQHAPQIQGFRQILQPPNRPKGLCLQPQFVKSIRTLGEIGKSYDICIRPGELGDGARLADLCPKTRFVLDHCGNGEAGWGGKGPEYAAWAKGITEVSKRKNVICKLSGIIKTCTGSQSKAEQLRPLVHHVLDAFGPGRVIWASDWPVCELAAPLREWVEVARTLTHDLPAADQRRIFHDNAVRFYGV
jgi:L-fuconolactonase